MVSLTRQFYVSLMEKQQQKRFQDHTIEDEIEKGLTLPDQFIILVREKKHRW